MKCLYSRIYTIDTFAIMVPTQSGQHVSICMLLRRARARPLRSCRHLGTPAACSHNVSAHLLDDASECLNVSSRVIPAIAGVFPRLPPQGGLEERRPDKSPRKGALLF